MDVFRRSDGPLRGRHRLLLEVGRGGMGTVYLALAQGPAGFNKLKVVKRLRPDLAADPAFLQMFLDEARIAARLNHPNVVQTFEVGFDGVNYFLEMEYLEGQSFDAIQRRAQRGAGLPLPIALWILHEALEGLHYAHELRDATGAPLRVVHRDVSPHNIFVTYDGAVKVLDFGIAKAADSSADTRTGVIKGKTTYMAPEQAEKKAVDRRADLFAVGVMLWQALTGTRLWAELGDTEILERLRRGAIPAPRTVKPDVPPQLESICMKALAQKPEDRFATAAELEEAIAEYLETTSSRVGNKQVGRYVAEAFAERRAAVQMEIDAQLRESPTTVDRGIDVPVLAEQPAVKGTASGEVSTAVTRPHGPSPAGQGVVSPARRGRLTALLIAAAGVAAGLAAFLLLSGNTSPHGGDRAEAGESARAPGGECATTADCARPRGAGTYVCRVPQRRCARLDSDACRVLAEPSDIEDDATLWIGAMFPLTGDAAEKVGKPALNAADLARVDFARVSNGIPRPSGGTHPLALVACDDAKDPERVARHLVEDVGVSAIIGFRSTKTVLDLGPSLFIPHDTLALAALNQSPLLARVVHPLDRPRMVYRTNVSLESFAAPVASLVTDVIERELRAARIVSEDRPMRVAVVRASATSGTGYAEILLRSLRFNGKSAVENGAAYREMTYGDPAQPGLETRFRALVPELLGFQPHVIVWPADDLALTEIVVPLEQGWPRDAPRPRYVSTELFLGARFFPFFHARPERSQRFFCVNTPASTAANVAFTVRYNEEHTPHVSTWEAPGPAYDAVYLLAYAAAASGVERPSGLDIARALPKITDRRSRVDTSPTLILDAFATLRGGGTFQLNGTVTRLEFDPETGDSTADFAVYCPRADEAAGSVANLETGLHFNVARGAFEGSAKCP